MQIIEPCCAKKQLLALRTELEKKEIAQLEGFGDMSLTELMTAMMTRYSETEVLIAAPALPDQAASAVAHWMRKQWAQRDGKGKLNVIARLTLVTDLSEKKSPMASAWLQDNPFCGRMTLRNVQQNDTAILLPDIAIYGNINLVYGGHFSAIATKNDKTIQALRTMYEGLK